MKAISKDRIRTIRKTWKRFLSIVLMAMLGTGVFVGIRASGNNMLHQLKSYYDIYPVFDLKLSSTLGMTKEDLEAIQNLDQVKEAYGIYELDAYLETGDTQHVVKVSQVLPDKKQFELIEGTLPSAIDECVIDQDMAKDLEVKIGDQIQIKEDAEEEEEQVLVQTNFKVTGISQSPLAITEEKGTSTLGARKSRIFHFNPCRQYRF